MSLQRADEVNGRSICTQPICNQSGSVETSLVAAARSGDAAAFERLVARHEQRLRILAQRITHNREDAEDAVQGSLLQAFVHLRSFRGDSPFSAWLTRIVTNEALMHLRKDRRRKEVPFDDANGADAFPQWEVVDFGLSPEEGLFRQELQQILTRLFGELKPRSRMVLQLRYSKQLSMNATAQVLSLPVSTVKTRLHRARQEMRQILEKHFETTAMDWLQEL